MSFKGIKGQDKALSLLSGALSNDRIAQGYIFAGPGGIGKMLTAVNFAKAINCQLMGKDRPCGDCVSCKKIDSSNHPDVSIIKAQKEGSSIGIDDIREMIRSIGMKPYEGRKKIYIIDNADTMTQEASNALLKTLEEPVSESVIILIVQNINLLSPTIRSRSQTVRFLPLETGEVMDFLVKAGVDEPGASILSSFASGRLGKAIRDKDTDFLAKRQRILNALLNRTFLDMEFDKASKAELKSCLDIMLTWYRDILIAQCGGSEKSLFNVDKKDVIFNEAKNANIAKIEKAIRGILDTYSFLDTNANPKLAMGVLGLKI